MDLILWTTASIFVSVAAKQKYIKLSLKYVHREYEQRGG